MTNLVKSRRRSHCIWIKDLIFKRYRLTSIGKCNQYLIVFIPMIYLIKKQ